MSLITLTPESIEQEHICCAIGNTLDAKQCSAAKKQWLLSSFKHGYEFCKADVRGKVFIETVPAQNAWAPIDASGWLFIDCLWASGKFKGAGYGSILLQHAINRAKNENYHGLVAISSQKKQPFLSDPSFYAKKGFTIVDTAPPYFTLVALPLQSAPLPKFKVVPPHPIPQRGIYILYSDHCPHTSKYVPLLEKTASAMSIPFTAEKITSCKQAQNSPAFFTTYSMFYNGVFLTNEIYSPAKLEKFIQQTHPSLL